MESKILLLHNIRSAENVGAIFRTADAIGINKILISGFTPTPLDRFKRPHTKVTKAALGAEQTVPWEAVDNVFFCITKLKQEGFSIVALEQHQNSQDYKTYKAEQKTAIVVGNETDGVDPEILGCVDAILEIPMRGQKNSLNVATACGIALFRLFDTSNIN